MKKARVLIVSGLLLLLITCASFLFWREDWQYLSPTPMPENYHPVTFGEVIPLTPEASALSGKPILLHFFNPDCACSQFNIPHFISLKEEYGNTVNFAVVAMSKTQRTVEDIREIFGEETRVILDQSLADSCGVYSTPQAVLIDGNGQLYYRGNYNRSRFCTERETSYAKIAIDSLLANQDLVMDPQATTSYGCQLPNFNCAKP